MKYVICAYRDYGIMLYENLKEKFNFTLIKLQYSKFRQIWVAGT